MKNLVFKGVLCTWGISCIIILKNIIIIIIIIIIIRFFAKLFDRSWSFVLQHFCFQEERNHFLSSLFCSNLRLSEIEDNDYYSVEGSPAEMS